MKRFTLLFAAFLFAGSSFHAYSAESENASGKGDPKVELQQLVGKIKAKLTSGTTTEQGLQNEMKEFDVLLAEHKGERTDDVANILFMEAMLYLQIFENYDKGEALLQRLKTDFPDSAQAKGADSIISSLAQQKQAEAIRKTLVAGNPFPDFKETDINGKQISISGLKGKVVLVDFWATWCGPCVAELPNVLKTYEANHPKGLEIVGVSLDQDKDKLTSFISEHHMTWPQYFDGKGWSNKVSTKYGITSIPATYLLDRDGKIIGANLRGEALGQAVEKALASK